MTGLNDIYGGAYLRADDIENNWPVTYTIKSTEIVSYEDGKKQVALNFHEIDKKLGLNKTNANRIAMIYGDDWEHGWIDKKVKLVLEYVDFQGKTVKAIRVPMPSMKPNPAEQAVKEIESPKEDDIPW
jgi:hypothetical protein